MEILNLEKLDRVKLPIGVRVGMGFALGKLNRGFESGGITVRTEIEKSVRIL